MRPLPTTIVDGVESTEQPMDAIPPPQFTTLFSVPPEIFNQQQTISDAPELETPQIEQDTQHTSVQEGKAKIWSQTKDTKDISYEELQQEISQNENQQAVSLIEIHQGIPQVEQQDIAQADNQQDIPQAYNPQAVSLIETHRDMPQVDNQQETLVDNQQNILQTEYQRDILQADNQQNILHLSQELITETLSAQNQTPNDEELLDFSKYSELLNKTPVEMEEELIRYQESTGTEIQNFITETVSLFRKHPSWFNLTPEQQGIT